MKVKASEETSLNEIEFLRYMSQKEKSLKVVDFVSNIPKQNPSKPPNLKNTSAKQLGF